MSKEQDVYKGYRIRLRLDESPHGLECPELDLFDETLAGLKSKIKAHLGTKKVEKAPAVPALKISTDGSFKEVKITSLAEYSEAWVVEDKRRYKCNRHHLIADTAENRAALLIIARDIERAGDTLRDLAKQLFSLPKPAILAKTESENASD